MSKPLRQTHEEATGWDDVEIRRLIEGRQASHIRKDAAAIAAVYTDEAVRYDLAPPLLHRGINRSELDAWLATWDGPLTIDVDDLEISVDGALAVAHGLTRMIGRKHGGGDVDLWFRTTIALKKQHGRWRIVHEHESVPFYMDGSFRAAIDLTPESGAA